MLQQKLISCLPLTQDLFLHFQSQKVYLTDLKLNIKWSKDISYVTKNDCQVLMANGEIFIQSEKMLYQFDFDDTSIIIRTYNLIAAVMNEKLLVMDKNKEIEEIQDRQVKGTKIKLNAEYLTSWAGICLCFGKQTVSKIDKSGKPKPIADLKLKYSKPIFFQAGICFVGSDMGLQFGNANHCYLLIDAIQCLQYKVDFDFDIQRLELTEFGYQLPPRQLNKLMNKKNFGLFLKQRELLYSEYRDKQLANPNFPVLKIKQICQKQVFDFQNQKNLIKQINSDKFLINNNKNIIEETKKRRLQLDQLFKLLKNNYLEIEKQLK